MTVTSIHLNLLRVIILIQPLIAPTVLPTASSCKQLLNKDRYNHDFYALLCYVLEVK